MTTKDVEYWKRQRDMCQQMYSTVLANYVAGDDCDTNYPETRHERLFHWLGKLGEAKRELRRARKREASEKRSA